MDKNLRKVDIAIIALDLAHVLIEAGEEAETIINSDETKRLVESIQKLINDIEGK